jgi:hypothetical protein
MTTGDNIDWHHAARDGVPQVIFHGFNEAGSEAGHYRIHNIDNDAIVATRFCTDISWTHSINAPYETMEMSLSFPEGQMQVILPGLHLGGEDAEYSYPLRTPTVGFWCVLYLPNKDITGQDCWSAIHWGRCTGITGSVVIDDITGQESVQVSLSFSSWQDLLAKNSLALVPGEKSYIQEGFSYTLKSWTENLTAMMHGAFNQEPAFTFETLFYNLLHIYLPNTLMAFTGSLISYVDAESGATKVLFDEEVPMKLAFERHDAGLPEIPLLSVKAKPMKMKDCIGFVGHREDAVDLAPLRLMQQKAVTGGGLNAVGSRLPRGTTWSVFEQTFFADPLAVECFPSLEWPVMWDGLAGKTAETRWKASDVPTDNQKVAQAVSASMALGATSENPFWSDFDWLTAVDTAGRPLKDLSSCTGAVGFTKSLPPGPGEVPAPFNGDAKKAGKEKKNLRKTQAWLCEQLGGSMPVLIYRMKPRLFRPINKAAGTESIRLHHPKRPDIFRIYSKTPQSELAGVNQAHQIVSQYPNFKDSENNGWLWYSIGFNDILGIDWRISDDSRINAVTSNCTAQPETGMTMTDITSKMIIDNDDLALHGLRLKTVDWPFLPAGQVGKADWVMQFTALNEELHCELASNDMQGGVYGNAHVESRYKPWIKAGHWTTGVYSERKPIIDPQKPSRHVGNTASPQAPGWSGYIQSVTHSMTIEQKTGAVEARTTLTISDFRQSGYDVVTFNTPPAFDGWEFSANPFIIKNGRLVAGKVEIDEFTGIPEFTPSSPQPDAPEG